MKYNIPERVLRDISVFAKKYSINKEVTIQREVILILLYMVEILILFIGILKKKYIPF